MPRFSLTALADWLHRPRAAVPAPESVWANHRTVVVDTTWALEPHSIPPGVVRRVTDRLATTDPATEAEMQEKD